MDSTSQNTLFFAISRLLLLLLLINETQSCPKSIDFDCHDHAYNNGETSLAFPFTNISQPDCGACVLTCQSGHTLINCMGMEDPDANYLLRALDINPSNLTIVVAAHPNGPNLPDVPKNDSCLVSNAGFPSTQMVSITNGISQILEGFQTFFRCRYWNESLIWDSKHYNVCESVIVYGPYEQSHLPQSTPPPQDCINIQVPKVSSKDGNLSIHYHISDKCNECSDHGGRCYNDYRNGEVSCDHSTKGNTLKVKIYSVAAGLTAIIFILILYWQRRKFKGSSNFLSGEEFMRENKNFETYLENYAHLTPKRYTHSNIKKMTNSFKEKLGEGGFGGVYKGKLLDGRLVAVKLLKNSKGHGEGFINEVASIGRTNHINIVTLLGYCNEGRKRALVYEYMANGSLEKFMHCEGNNNGNSLPLETLFQIVLGIARGLEYLHRGCKTRILHFDIKPHNILLDEEFCPKISDFGLAKLTPQDKQSKVSMSGTRGTIGYIAPEVFCRTFGDVSHKSDVYSFGMMVLEVIGSRRKVNSQVENSSDLYFPQYVYKQLEQGDEVEIDIVVSDNEKQLKRKMIVVSLWCTQPAPSSRPSMSTVVQMLEGSPESIDIPPLPTFSSPPRLQWDPSTSSITTDSQDF